ncbi:MAG: UDP-N-acetylglucosamine 1-carboxyvinyltransferase [Acidimicrobiia bacterium]|nr:UDP-N-acetylglucosamine 1-carboxyvinyltransferase [Acidimicrobiia bacterium]
MTSETHLEIRGGTALEGEVPASGAKNSALKLLAASLLAPGGNILANVPDVADVNVMFEVLESIGADVTRTGDSVMIDVPTVPEPVAAYELTSRMRASIQVLGPLLARCGRARVAMPGGCNLGSRKLDMHLAALEEMGAEFSTDHGDLVAVAPRLRGRRIVLEFPSMGATENVILAAVGASGVTEIENAAREPEIQDLCEYLAKMGVEIEGAGGPTIRIQGRGPGATGLAPATHTTIGDRIEVGTYLVAGAVTDGDVTVRACEPGHLELFLNKLEQIGVEVDTGDTWIRVRRTPSGLRAADIVTLPYPGFPTDLMPQTVALLSLADGSSVVTENVFDARFQFVFELNRMGALIRTEGRHSVVTGVEKLQSAPVVAHDIRAGAAVVCAGLAAHGTTRIANLNLLDRGYENLTAKLGALGAEITRTT